MIFSRIMWRKSGWADDFAANCAGADDLVGQVMPAFLTMARPMFRLFDRTARPSTIADLLFADCVQRSRDVRFYRDCAVGDTVAGRFEMLALHVALLMRRLGRIEPAGLKISRALAEVMFASLDDDMRELGVGYLSVPKKMRKTAAAFYGRAASYDAALAGGDEAALVAALERNIYGSAAGAAATAAAPAVTRLAADIRELTGRLDAATDQDVLAARGFELRSGSVDDSGEARRAS